MTPQHGKQWYGLRMNHDHMSLGNMGILQASEVLSASHLTNKPAISTDDILISCKPTRAIFWLSVRRIPPLGKEKHHLVLNLQVHLSRSSVHSTRDRLPSVPNSPHAWGGGGATSRDDI
eukprot:766278-Hanusia_phi.AAC.4